METMLVRTGSRIQFVDITGQVREVIARIATKDGVAIVYVPHTTAGITINEAADPSVPEDINTALSGLVPHHRNYRHSEGNADAHIKATLVGSSVNVILSKGELVLGTWQGIFLCEFDGPRSRTVMVKILPG
ncbi:MAG: YjbQ family protein [Desulfomonile tiedjei]|nr:YjbQ family protein [Desulfomonile tiedjei]